MKFSKYQDVERNIILLKDIADIEPYHITLPEPPKPKDIKNYGLKIEDQFYKRESVPRKIWEITRALNTKQITRKDAENAVKKDHELASFIESQWRKRVDGEWCYIYGKPIYLTGDNWMYLNYYQMDIGLPSFRKTDNDKYLWWRFAVEENDSVFGGVDFDKRRNGKSFFAGNVLTSYITRHRDSFAGVQSKTELDAKKFFAKAVTYAIRRYPFFFKPNMYMSSSEVDFSHEDIQQSLESKIDFQSSNDRAYDGQKLHRYLLDEAGKMEDPANPVEIWDKVKFCLLVDGKIIGKALITTTVEEMVKGGGEKFKFIYDESSRKKDDLKSNGQTKTGLVQYFTSAYYSEVLDQYGYSIVGTPTPAQQEYLKSIKDPLYMIGGMDRVNKEIAEETNPIQRQNLIRKKPPTIRDAFRYNNTGCLYDPGIINDRLTYFNYGYPKNYPMTFGYFKWVSERFGDVEFIPTEEKHPMTRMHIRYLPHPDLRNKFVVRNGKKCPANTARFNASADPFKLKTEQIKYRKDMSYGGAHVFALHDPSVDNGKPRAEWLTDNFAVEYLFRPDTPDEFAEDVAMMCIFYGCQVFPEPNVQLIDDKFREWGLIEYLQFRQKKSQKGNMVILKEDKKMAGEYNTDYFRPTLIRHGINYIKDKGMYCPFPRTLEQLRDMSYDNFNEFDLATSALYVLTGVFDLYTSGAKKEIPRVRFDGIVPELRTYGGS